MKKSIKKVIPFALALSMLSSVAMPVFADEENVIHCVYTYRCDENEKGFDSSLFDLSYENTTYENYSDYTFINAEPTDSLDFFENDGTSYDGLSYNNKMYYSCFSFSAESNGQFKSILEDYKVLKIDDTYYLKLDNSLYEMMPIVIGDYNAASMFMLAGNDSDFISVDGIENIVSNGGTKIDVLDYILKEINENPEKAEMIYKYFMVNSICCGENDVRPLTIEEAYMYTYDGTYDILKGDIDGDNAVDLKDLGTLKKYIIGVTDLTPAQKMLASTNDEEEPDIRDVTKMNQYLVKTIDEL